MTTDELRNRTSVKQVGYGQYEVRIKYRGKEYKCLSDNSTAVDRLDDGDLPERKTAGFYTNKRAWKALYDECKRKNNLM